MHRAARPDSRRPAVEQVTTSPLVSASRMVCLIPLVAGAFAWRRRRHERSERDQGGAADTAEDGRIALVFEEARRSNTQQQRVLDELRSRTATLLSATAISTAFLGAQALAEGGFGSTGVAATLSFVAAELMCLVILVPKGKWLFRFEVHGLLRDYVDETPVTLDHMRAILAEHLEENFQANENRMKQLFLAFRAGAGFLMIEVLLWLFELGS